MAFNKSKALESALKFMNQGRLPDAIRESQGILRMDPRDQVTLMTGKPAPLAAMRSAGESALST